MLPQFDTTWHISQALWLLVTFGALFLAMKAWLLPLLQTTLLSREVEIMDSLKEAESLKDEARVLAQQMDKRAEETSLKKKRFYTDAQAEAELFATQMQSRFDEERAVQSIALEKHLETEKKIAMSEISSLSQQMISEIALKVSGLDLSLEEIAPTLSEVLEEKTQ